MSKFRSIEFKDNKLVLIDQTKLPLVEEYIKTDDYERAAIAIERLEVRGAPAIGVTAAYAVALAFSSRNEYDKNYFEKVYSRLARTRPTAVNLFWALDEMKNLFYGAIDKSDVYSALLQKAIEIHEDDIKKCDAMGRNSLSIFKKGTRALTHCNTGQLATGGSGTAFSVLKHAYEEGFLEFVHADETRPLLQGSRLTAFELEKAGIPFAVNVDSASGYLIGSGKVDLVITGADRITANGDAANKVGTLNLAIICKHYGIPFYIAAPTTTIDSKLRSGKEIEIEMRSGNEVNEIAGAKITKDSYDFITPAFDVTPNELIAGIITEKGLHKPPYDFR